MSQTVTHHTHKVTSSFFDGTVFPKVPNMHWLHIFNRAATHKMESACCTTCTARNKVLYQWAFIFKSTLGFKPGMKLSLAATLMLLNWVCPVLSFSWTLSTNHYCLVHFVLSFSTYFMPLFNKISWLCGQQPAGGDEEASNGGWNSGPTGHDFPDLLFKHFTMRTGPFSKCEHRSGSQIESIQSGYHGGSHWPVLTQDRTETRCRFSSQRVRTQCFYFILFYFWRIFATWRPKKKVLANPTKGFFRFKKRIAISWPKKI